MLSRKAVLSEHQQFGYSVSKIVDMYSEWVSEDKYMILNRVKLKTVKVRDSRNNRYFTVQHPVESETFAIKCSKRGNDVYRSRVYRRFKGLTSYADKTDFFNPKDKGGIKQTRALFVTLTYDIKRCSFSDAWQNIGIEFNRFMSSVRKKFGKVSCCRVFEAYSNGHPHVHCILLFEEKQFKVFRDKKGQFRVKEKGLIEEGWHSHTDVKAMSSLGRGFAYLKKYLLKSIDKENKDSKTLKTLALGWLFNKRAFSVSGKFRKMLSDLIKSKHNSNPKKMQITLNGEPIAFFVFAFVGIVPCKILNLTKHQQKGRFIELDIEQTKSLYVFLEKKQIYNFKNSK